MATRPGDSARDMADSPLAIDPAEFQGIVADAFGGRLSKLNGSVTITADVLDELKEVATEAIEEAQKLDAAEKALDDAYAADQSDKETYDKGVQEAKDALEAAQTEYDRREKELLAKLESILAKILGISDDGSPLNDDDNWGDGDPKKRRSDAPSSDSPSSDNPSSDSHGDSPSSDSPGQTKLSSDTSPTAQQQQAYPNVTPQQAQQQQQPAGMSPSMGMPQSQSPSSSLSSPRPRDRDKDKRQDSDIDRGVLPVAAPVATPVPIDRGTSGTGITNRDVSGKPSTSLSTSGQVPGSVNGQNPRGGVGGGMVGGGAPIGAGSKSDTASKRSSKRFDLESLFTKPDDNDQSVNSGSLSRDSLAATDKAREAEKDRMQEAMRESVKRLMNKKAG